ncbi:hypothetical protein SynWH8101_1756 [Synechococcus sp. WH 8101]|nr:hypothetical protein SynWH8101_1756 [Synechococcus sp. WH 8101]QNI45579.1 hypothetical protein SynRCC2555_01798 [Synechococcus sp. WH 8101]
MPMKLSMIQRSVDASLFLTTGDMEGYAWPTSLHFEQRPQVI